MLNIDYKINEVVERLDYTYEEFKKLTFKITLDKWEDKEVFYVVINVNDNETLEMGNGVVIIMAGDNVFEIKKEISKYSKAIKKEFSVKSDYEMV